MSEWDLPNGTENVNIEKSGGDFVWDSGVYDTKVKLAYLDKAESGAISANFILADAAGKELKETQFIKSGNAKGNKTTYEKDGKLYPLPGYSVVNSLCMAATGTSLSACMAHLEKKHVKVYDATSKKEVPKERPVLMDLIGKPVKVAVSKLKVYKQKKNSKGIYEDTAETRFTNECKFFGNEAGFSAEEIESKATEAVALKEWADKNTGNVYDKTAKTVGKTTTSAADIMNNAATSSESLFG